MSGNGSLVIATVLGLILWAALYDEKPKWFSFGGLVQRDRRGRITILLTPAKRKGKKRR